MKTGSIIAAVIFAVLFPFALLSGSYDPSYRFRLLGWFGPHSPQFMYTRYLLTILVILVLIYLNRKNVRFLTGCVTLSLGAVTCIAVMDYFFFRRIIYNYGYALWLCAAICIACVGAFAGATLFINKDYPRFFKAFWLSFICIYAFILFISFVREPHSYRMEVNLKIGKGTFYYFGKLFGDYADKLYLSLVCVGNLVIFIPLPFILYVVRNKVKWYHILIGLLLPPLIELYQYLLECGNVDIDDVLLNWSGLFIGYILLFIIRKNKLTPAQQQ